MKPLNRLYVLHYFKKIRTFLRPEGVFLPEEKNKTIILDSEDFLNINNKVKENFFKPSRPGDIEQGDILYTEMIDKLISREDKELIDEESTLSSSVYPYFFKKYKLSVVLNASCDITTSREAKVECIQLAALYPLEDVMKPIVKRFANGGEKFNIISASDYADLEDEFRKIVDGQNKTRFFLPNIQIDGVELPDTAWVVRLDVIISLRFKHREAFVSAKTGLKLEEHRASKLAENAGALFNRIGMRDVNDILDDGEYKIWVQNHLGNFCIPVKDAIYYHSIRDLKKLDQPTKKEITRVIRQHNGKTKHPDEEKLLGLIKKQFGNVKDFDNRLQRLENDQQYKSIIKKIAS